MKKVYLGTTTKVPALPEIASIKIVAIASGILTRATWDKRIEQLEPETWSDPDCQEAACLAQQLYAQQEGIA